MIHAADVAESQVGVRERTGANDGIPAERYMRGDELHWCAGFVLFCDTACDAFRFPRSVAGHYALRSVAGMVAWARARGRFFERGTIVPQRNDVIIFDGHCGLVTAVDGDDVKTVEGNSGDKVARRSYNMSDTAILGYIR